MELHYIWLALQAAAAKIPTTLLLALLPLALGTLLGLPLALARHFKVKLVSQGIAAAVTVIKGVPVVLMLMVFYVAASDTLGLAFRDFPKELVAVAALTVYAAAAMSEVLRGALASVKKGQYDAGYAAGLTTAQILRRVVLPQALPVSLPMACNVCIALLKSAALGSLVSVIDVMNAAVVAVTPGYRFLEGYAAAALVYWALCFGAEKLFGQAEKIYAKRRQLI
jgi:L-cystine transport system permease protein